MASAVQIPFVSVEEYLATSYEPDVDYVDGLLEERALGEFDHSDVQWAILAAINRYTADLGIRARPELRVQVGPTRFRVPDVCVLGTGWKTTQIIQEAPLLCVEVLSPEDRLHRAVTRCHDYLGMGCAEVWIANPREKSIVVVREGGTITLLAGKLRLPSTTADIAVEDLFRGLEKPE